jgi:vacuolar protein sorting-associated protein 26
MTSLITGLMGGNAVDIDIHLKDAENYPQCMGKNENGEKELQYLFTANDTIAGTCSIRLKGNKKVEHLGIKIELIGQIELSYDKSTSSPYEFISLVRELEVPGEITESKTYPFEFANVDKSYETYQGNNVKLRYFLRVVIQRQFLPIKKIMDFQVQNVAVEPETNPSIKFEVGIEDCLHIEFEYNKSKYHLQDVVIGKIYFLLVRIKIKHMEVVIVKRESTPSTGSSAQQNTDSENIAKYEIMDGAPVRGESIPVRLYLAPYPLSPSYKSIHNKFSVRYFLNLVLVDEEDRRYFKQQEITLWRRQLNQITGDASNPENKSMFETK